MSVVASRLHRLRFIPRHKFKLTTMVLMPTYIYQTYNKVREQQRSLDMSYQGGLEMPKTTLDDSEIKAATGPRDGSVLGRMVWKAKLLFRTITLVLLFLPSAILSPMLWFAPDRWCSLFAYCVELAGPVFIKLA